MSSDPFPYVSTHPLQAQKFLSSGSLTIGANYWASHAGPQMWSQWDAGVVARDFSLLASSGVTALRVFPLWPDFQPIHCLRTALGAPMEIRFGEAPLPENEIARAGVSERMLERFRILADLAARESIQLIVGLVTGWMSGRLFVPPALEGLNPITDPVAIMWQVRLVRTMVRIFKAHPAISAWDLGNECNVMGEATREQSWLWTSALSDAIRAHDPTRPVVSGMHSLSVDPRRPWAIYDQGELTDILTTHPYPLFTPHCNREPMDTIRPLLHSTAETCLYADLSGKPAFVEEVGNFGPFFCSETKGANILRSTLASVWAHDCRAALWWCAFDQLSLTEAPHDWVAMERELGLLRQDGGAKPLVSEIHAFQDMLRQLPFGKLPRRRIDAVCVLTPGQDQWGAAYSAFVLAKQAGFDIQFHFADRALPPADLYLLPSLAGQTALSRRREFELREKVEAGASLYVSVDDGCVREIFEMTGLGFSGRCGRSGLCEFDMPGGCEAEHFAIASSTRFDLDDGRATILARESNGCPVFSMASCGKGKVFFLSAPLETALASNNAGVLPEETPPYWKIYRRIAEDLIRARLMKKTSPSIGITEHFLTKENAIVVLINYSPHPVEDTICLSGGVTRCGVLFGEPSDTSDSSHLTIQLPANGYAIWECESRSVRSN